MSKRAKDAALKAYPTHKGASKEWIKHYLLGGDCAVFIKGYEQAEKDLGWHPSTEHPPVDEEVIVLTDIITKGGLNAGLGKIAFGHIVDKDIAVDYDGWNIEGVRYWMPMPKIPKEK